MFQQKREILTLRNFLPIRYCVVSLSAAVAVVLIRVPRCKKIHCEQIGRLGSLERAATVFEESTFHNIATFHTTIPT